MPVLVSTTAWRTAARLGEIVRAKRLSPRMRHSWSQVYRLVLSGGRLCLQTTDGRLSWILCAEMDRPQQEFDVLVSAREFDGLRWPKEWDGVEIEHDAALNLLTIRRGLMVLRMTADPSHTYPKQQDESSKLAQATDERHPDRAKAVRWMIDARTLFESLEFVSPLVARPRFGAETSVVAYLPGGRLVGGTPLVFGTVEGLPSPPTVMSYSRPSAEVLAAFLAELGGAVQVEISKPFHRFTCPNVGHELHLLSKDGAPPPWPQPDDEDYEEILIDRRSFTRDALIARVCLPKHADRLEVLIRGDAENASLRLSTPDFDGAGTPGSFGTRGSFYLRDVIRDVRPLIHRPGEEREAPDSRFSVLADHLCTALERMKGETLRLVYYGRLTLLRIDDAAEGPGETKRSAFLSIREHVGRE